MPRTCWVRFQLLLCAVALCLEASAQSDRQFLVKNLGPEDGLPQSSVFTEVQTRDGYLWVGTGNGLARFDGLRFKTFDEDQAPELSGSKIIKLFEDSRRNLWIATDNAGVLLVDEAGRTQTVHKASPEEGPLVSICEDPSGGVWFAMSKGQLFRYRDGKAEPFLKNCRGLICDTSGVIWIGSPDGRLFGLGPVSNMVSGAVPVPYELRSGGLDYLLASRDGGYWRFAGGRIQKWRKDQMEKDLGSYPWSAGVPVTAACEDLEGNLIAGTFDHGLYWFDATGGYVQVEDVQHDPDEARLSQQTVWSLVIDREGSLWVGTNGKGLYRVRPQRIHVLDGTKKMTVQSVCSDKKGGLWIGYHSDRVDHWTGQNLVPFTNIWPAEVPRLFIQTVLEDASGRVWVGGESGVTPPQFCFFTLLQERFFSVAGPPMLNQNPCALFQSRNGALWVGTQGGLGCLENGKWRVFSSRDGLSSDSVRAIAEDRQGAVWVGTDHGLNRLQNGKLTVFHKQGTVGLPGESVASLYVDADDVLWIGTSSGLARYAHGDWERFTTKEGLASNKISYLIEDSEGYLWIGSNNGLMRVLKKALNEFSTHKNGPVPCRVFGKGDGLPAAECSGGSQPAACRTADGQLWLPTINGLAVVQPALLQPNTNPPPVLIESVLIDGALQGQDHLRAPVPRSVTMPADRQSLEVHFASLNLAAPDGGWFQYRLFPHEKEWTPAEPQRRYARYSRLPPGSYQFEVKACNEDGVWNQAPTVVAVTVLPPFWRTWWFIGSSTLLLLGLVAGSVHYVSTQRLQRQVAALQQQEALERERARIARDLHDQLGANLTQVALLGEMAEADKDAPAEIEAHARQICQTARETTHALDEIVWTVNPSNDTLDGLINYVCKYAQEYLAMAGLKYRLEVPSALPPVPISPELRHNLFLAAKEAINNVVKHAQATAAWVRLALEPGRFVLEIEDNGRGVKPEDETKGRNGLRNMRKRMEEIGGNFEVMRGATGGTRVRLIAPLHQGSLDLER